MQRNNTYGAVHPKRVRELERPTLQKNLSGTISRLKLLRGLQAQAPAAAPSGRLLELTGFGANPGALQGWFYLPDGLRRAAPLVVVLHGCTQTSAGYDWGSGWSELADQEGFALLFPEQQRSNNANLCFNWFQPSDTRRDSGEALSIREMIETMLTAHGLDRGRVFITGLSAGGAMAAAVLAAYPETFAAGAIIAGLPVGVAHTVPEAFERMRGNGLPSPEKLQELLRQASLHRGPWPRISVWHGTLDSVVAPANARAVVDQWLAVHGLPAEPHSRTSAGGHQRLVWRDGRGRELIESISIAGMNHGTPLNTRGARGLGHAGPFMLDVGVSSTRRIAEGWGIASLEPAEIEPARAPRASQPNRAGTDMQAAGDVENRLGGTTSATDDPPVPNAIRKTIEDALRSAGLMR